MIQDDDAADFYILRFSEPAEAELEAAYLQLSAYSFALAERWNRGILAACQSLSQLPRRYPLAPEQASGGYETRRMLFRTGSAAYWILYSIAEASEDGPALVRILHLRRSS